MRTAPYSVVMAQFYRLHTSIQEYLLRIEMKCVVLYCVIVLKQAKLLNIVTKSKNDPCSFPIQMYVTQTTEQSTCCFAYTFLLLQKWEFGPNTFLKFVSYIIRIWCEQTSHSKFLFAVKHGFLFKIRS